MNGNAKLASRGMDLVDDMHVLRRAFMRGEVCIPAARVCINSANAESKGMNSTMNATRPNLGKYLKK